MGSVVVERVDGVRLLLYGSGSLSHFLFRISYFCLDVSHGLASINIHRDQHMVRCCLQ